MTETITFPFISYTEAGFLFLSFCYLGNVTRDREKSREKLFHREGVTVPGTRDSGNLEM